MTQSQRNGFRSASRRRATECQECLRLLWQVTALYATGDPERAFRLYAPNDILVHLYRHRFGDGVLSESGEPSNADMKEAGDE